MVGDGGMMAFFMCRSLSGGSLGNRRVTRLPAFSKRLSFPLSFYPSFLLLSGPESCVVEMR